MSQNDELGQLGQEAFANGQIQRDATIAAASERLARTKERLLGELSQDRLIQAVVAPGFIQ